MRKKLERVFRDRKLTPEEVAQDEDIRRKVQAEFPPARPAAPPSPESLSECLKTAMCQSGKPVDQIAKDAGVSQTLIARFLAGDRDIHMTTADKLAESLGLKLATEA